MIKKILKWAGILMLLVITAVTVVTASRQNLKYDAPYPDIKASTDSTVISRGKELIYGPAHCIDCHSTVNNDSLIKFDLDIPLTGGVLFNLPVGKIYSKNITPDKETGIGNYSDAEVARVLRYGVHPNGDPVYNFMPFQNMSDEDLTAIISYLRIQKPIHNKVPNNDLNIAGNLVKAFLVKPVGPDGGVPKSVRRDTSAAYGKYITMSIGNCNGCHTKRNMAGEYVGEPFAGGNVFAKGLISPNLTPDSTSRIFGWSQQDFVNRFHMGKIIPYSEMPWGSFKHMSDNDLKAIYI
jgi:mono/diheme cytochrome c family protein